VAPGTSVAGQSQQIWSERWWQWASSFPRDASPVSDSTGERCGAGQSAPVWFLAGAFGSATVARHCTVPKDTYLFFPLVNAVVFPNRNSTVTCADAQQQAQAETDNPEILVAEIDAKRIPALESHRQATSRCFDLAAKADVHISIFPSAADGYYLMLSPLSKGPHTLRFGGRVGSLSQAISYDLTVE
jgi:hypothetical protein